MNEIVFPQSLERLRTRKSNMLAARIVDPRRTEVTSLPRPEPGPGEVLIRLEGCGMCASTLPKWEGREWFSYPLDAGDPGHEGFGYIEKIGDDVEELQVGDRVSGLSFKALAEYDVARADQVVKLPPALRHVTFPGEPLGCVMNIFERSDIHPGQTVAVIGIGFLGALLVELAKDRGATVIALSRRPFSLELAAMKKADHVIPLDDHHKVMRQVREITGEQWCDRVIEATGKQWPLDLAAELTAFGGKLVIAGYHQDGLRQVNMQLWNWRAFDVINAHERDPARYVEGMKQAIDAVAACRLDFTPLLTNYFFPDQIDQAFSFLEERPDGFVKGIVRF